MASKAIGSFHARASLDATDFDRGTRQMSSSMSAAGRVIDDQWNVIGSGAQRTQAQLAQMASTFAKGGLGPVFELKAPDASGIKAATIETRKLWAAQVQAKVAANSLAYSLGSSSGGAAAAVNALNRGQQAGSKAASRFGLIMQQSGYQVQDFAVQVAGGQSALVAFSQQGSQLLGIFGAAGAIAGAVLSVGVLGVRMLGLGDATKKAKVEVESIRESFLRLEETRKKVFNETADLPTRRSSAYEKAAADADKLAKGEASAARLRAELDKKYPVNQFTGSRETPFIMGRSQAKEEIERLRALDEYVGKVRANAAESQYALSSIDRELFEQTAERISQEEKLKQEADSRFMALRKENAMAEMDNESKLDYYLREMEFLDEIGAKNTEQYEIAKKRTRELGTMLLAQSGPAKGEILDYSRYEKTVLGLQSRMPQALQINAGTSALGGMVGSGAANQIIDIQKGILDGIRQLVRMEMLAGQN